jgi:hypothetical protein
MVVAPFGFGEGGVDAACLDDADSDPERFELVAQCVAHRLQGVLAHRVRAHSRHRDPARDRADIDDPAVPASPHAGYDPLHDAQDAHDVDIELPVERIEGEFLQRAAQRHACRIDQHVDVAGGGRGHVVVVGDVEFDGLGPHGSQLSGGVGIPVAGDDGGTVGEESLHDRAAQAAARADDQDRSCHVLLLGLSVGITRP